MDEWKKACKLPCKSCQLEDALCEHLIVKAIELKDLEKIKIIFETDEDCSRIEKHINSLVLSKASSCTEVFRYLYSLQMNEALRFSVGKNNIESIKFVLNQNFDIMPINLRHFKKNEPWEPLRCETLRFLDSLSMVTEDIIMYVLKTHIEWIGSFEDHGFENMNEEEKTSLEAVIWCYDNRYSYPHDTANKISKKMVKIFGTNDIYDVLNTKEKEYNFKKIKMGD